MLSGDFTTFPMSDLLQWFDQSRKAGVLEIESPSRRGFWIRVADRAIVGTSRPSVLDPGLPRPLSWKPTVEANALWADTSRDRILDLFFDQNLWHKPGRFTFSDEAGDFEEGIALDLPVQEITLDGLRRLDEWAHLDRAFADEAACLVLLDASGETGVCESALLEAAAARLSLAEVRLALGLSRPALLYRLEPLCLQGRLRVDRQDGTADPVGELLRQTKALLAQGQINEAAHVLESLLLADIAEPRIGELWQEVEREQVAALYQQLSPLAVPRLAAPVNLALNTRRAPAIRPLKLAEQELLGRINGRFDVATLVLATPRREIETLRGLRQLVRLGAVQLKPS